MDAPAFCFGSRRYLGSYPSSIPLPLLNALLQKGAKVTDSLFQKAIAIDDEIAYLMVHYTDILIKLAQELPTVSEDTANLMAKGPFYALELYPILLEKCPNGSDVYFKLLLHSNELANLLPSFSTVPEYILDLVECWQSITPDLLTMLIVKGAKAMQAHLESALSSYNPADGLIVALADTLPAIPENYLDSLRYWYNITPSILEVLVAKGAIITVQPLQNALNGYLRPEGLDCFISYLSTVPANILDTIGWWSVIAPESLEALIQRGATITTTHLQNALATDGSAALLHYLIENLPKVEEDILYHFH
jgi:hypothetical protein